ncbi:MAG: hypothetical protein ABSF44_06020 [Candidatus Bathyarchaeia archaeon]|jgi:hypothetical protein
MAVDSVIVLLGYAITFLIGVGSGLILEKKSLQYNTMKDNWNRLIEPIGNIRIVIRNLYYDCDHAIKTRNTSSTDNMEKLLQQINENLKYRVWFIPFEREGGIEKTDSIDEELGAALMGISNFANYNENDKKYAESRLPRLRKITGCAVQRIQEFNRAKIPHRKFLGKRKLEHMRVF